MRLTPSPLIAHIVIGRAFKEETKGNVLTMLLVFVLALYFLKAYLLHHMRPAAVQGGGRRKIKEESGTKEEAVQRQPWHPMMRT